MKPRESVDTLTARIADAQATYRRLAGVRAKLTEKMLGLDAQMKRDRDALAHIIRPLLEDPNRPPPTHHVGRPLSAMRRDDRDRVYAYIQALDGLRVDFAHLSEKVAGTNDRRAQKRVSYAICQLIKTGHIERVARWCYVVRG